MGNTVFSGRPLFCSESYDVELAMEILQGLREKPIPNTPENYIKIIYWLSAINFIMIYNNN
jgi:hypothetical protein